MKSLPRLLRDTSYNTTSFGHSLKTYYVSLRVGPTSAHSAVEALEIMHYINLRFTYLHTFVKNE